MAEGAMKLLRDSSVLVSAAELAEIVGIDLETVNNWLRRDIISRASIGGRQLRHRLFSTEQVCKAALTHDLVKLGISPSSASDAVNEVWKAWDKKELPDGRKIYALMLSSDAKWTAFLCWQKISGGPLYRLSKSSTTDFDTAFIMASQRGEHSFEFRRSFDWQFTRIGATQDLASKDPGQVRGDRVKLQDLD
jgi:hypothetical protein